MKKILSFVISITTAMIFVAGSATVSNAKTGENDIKITDEYEIADADGLHTRYVIIATNNSDKDLEVSAFFSAVASDGDAIKTVSDCENTVKAGQSFMLYGQFKNSDIEDAADFSYTLESEITENCRYDSVDIDVQKNVDNSLSVTGINNTSEDVSYVNVRTVFFKNGSPVAFDTVNLGDSAFSLQGEGSNTQELGMLLEDYDDYLLTYSVAGDM